MLPQRQQRLRTQRQTEPIGLRDNYKVPIPDRLAAEMTQKATETLRELPARLFSSDICSEGERTAADSMRQYEILDKAAQAIEILKAMNYRDREQLRQKANRKIEEDAPTRMNAFKYRVCPQEMEKMRREILRVRGRGCKITCLADCVSMRRSALDPPDFVHVLRRVGWAMDKVRVTVAKLETEHPEGHWAVGLLNFYFDAWIVYFDGLDSQYREPWYGQVLDMKSDDAVRRARVAEEIVREVEKEKGRI